MIFSMVMNDLLLWVGDCRNVRKWSVSKCLKKVGLGHPLHCPRDELDTVSTS